MTELLLFMQSYCEFTNSHDFNTIKPLLNTEAVYWFDDKSYSSINEIQTVFEKTWNSVPDEVYEINGIRWIMATPENAVCIYNYNWKGTYNNVMTYGSGKGTNVLVKQYGKWTIIHEHLSKDTILKQN